MGSHDHHSDKDLKSTSSGTPSIHSLPVPDQPEVESISTPLPATDGIHPLPNADHEDASTLEKQATASIASEDIEPIFVPKAQRRGLLARVAIIAEVEDPKHYARRTKWFITFVVAVAGAAAPMGSGIILPGLSQINREFNSPSTVTNLSVALYMLSMSVSRADIEI